MCNKQFKGEEWICLNKKQLSKTSTMENAPEFVEEYYSLLETASSAESNNNLPQSFNRLFLNLSKTNITHNVIIAELVFLNYK